MSQSPGHERLLVSLLLAALVWTDAAPAAEQATLTAPWGRFDEAQQSLGLWRVVPGPSIEGWQALPAKLPPVIRAYDAEDPDRTPLFVEWNDGTSPGRLRIPPAGNLPANTPRTILLETAQASGQFPDGRIVLRALDGERHGTASRETPSVRLPWINLPAGAGEFIVWKYKATRPGTYDVELIAAPRDPGITAEFSLGAQSVSARLPESEADSIFLPVTLGRLVLARPGEVEVRLRVGHSAGNASLKVGSILLRPASEGKPIVQSPDGSVSCHARDVTIHGVQVQFEPRPEKNTVGYWTNPKDRVSWAFALTRPGKFQVEILQGCGQGQGGSAVELIVGDQPLPFVVEDTGHFQNFVPRTIGTVVLERPGRYTIEVRPIRRAGIAVMDLRQVRLTPIE
jgi:hypothetical protein